MGRITAQRRPHYPPTERLAILVRITRILARAGLHLGPTTVRRKVRAPQPSAPCRAPEAAPHIITGRKPNDLWHVDLTTIPTSLGFWTSWVPFALPQVWPFCWWGSVAIDHCSRRVMGFAVFPRQPSANAVQGFWGVSSGSRATSRGIRQRFGAIGRYGSLAVIERCIRTLKTECTRRLTTVPYRLATMEQELAFYFSWYNGHRPHTRPTRSPAGSRRPLSRWASAPAHHHSEARRLGAIDRSPQGSVVGSCGFSRWPERQFAAPRVDSQPRPRSSPEIRPVGGRPTWRFSPRTRAHIRWTTSPTCGPEVLTPAWRGRS